MPEEDMQTVSARIAGGHAWADHHAEFPGCATTTEFQTLVLDALEHATAVRQLARGRSAYWSEVHAIVVILTPSDPDGGTAFRPLDGRVYFEALI